MKDEKALTEFLLKSSIANFRIVNQKAALTEEEIKKFVMNILKAEEMVRMKSADCDPDLARIFAALNVNLEKFISDEAYARNLIKEAQELAAKGNHNLTNIEISKFEANNIVKVKMNRMGQIKESVFDGANIKATQWKVLFSTWAQLQAVVELPIYAQAEKGDKMEFNSYKDFYDYFMEESKKGAYIQRYKGLGEMNPEQLWETTLNPANRTLLQVTVDDGMLADETFSILMGEEVEPRRQFIFDNALLAKELDV